MAESNNNVDYKLIVINYITKETILQVLQCQVNDPALPPIFSVSLREALSTT